MNDETRKQIQEHLAKQEKPSWPPFTPCKYAQVTEKQAFPERPCKGNRVLCTHPENRGFVSCQRECCREKCLYFEDQETVCKA